MESGNAGLGSSSEDLAYVIVRACGPDTVTLPKYEGIRLIELCWHDYSDPSPWGERVYTEKTKFDATWDLWFDEMLGNFRRIAIIDDDVIAHWPSVFAKADSAGASICQPAIIGGNWNHEITRVSGEQARWTNFVEVMAPIFSPWAFSQCVY